MIKHGLIFVTFLVVISSCSVSKSYRPEKRYSPQELRSDYLLLRKILEEKHPSLYWYTSKDSMDRVFDRSFDHIRDSMTEFAFGWRILAPVLAQIRCGHTSFLMSKGESKYFRGKRIPSFPLFVKVWNDSMMVVGNLNKDTVIKRGDFITSINGLPNRVIIDTLFKYMVKDGYNENLNYIRLSISFPYILGDVMGIAPNYRVDFTDSTGSGKVAVEKLYSFAPDSTAKTQKKPERKKHVTAQQKRNWIRSVSVDSTVAIMDLNAFSKGNLTHFFKRTFKTIRKNHTQNLIIDLRVNGGGDINKAINLMKYLRKDSFRIADTAFSIAKNFNPYARFISKSLWNNIALIFATREHKDGNYHFGYWERHVFRPKKRNHFDGRVYILTNGLTFSAASMLCALVKGRENITLVGEETGGGWYGNSGIMIPNITLPHTKIRVRLPFFRLVQSEFNPSQKGSGVVPDWYIGTNWRDILSGRDTKLEAVLQKIRGKE